MIVSMPSTRLKSPTIGIEPPSPIGIAFLPHSSFSAPSALFSDGLSKGSRNRRRAAKIAELDGAVDRQAVAHEISGTRRGFSRVLIADQTERHLRHRLSEDDGLGALARIAADDAIDLRGRPRGDLLEQQAVLLARRTSEADRPEEFLRRSG